MNLFMTDELGVREMVRDRFHTKEWWIILWGRNRGTADFIVDVEDTYYTGDKTEDFMLLMGMFTTELVAIALAKKKHMSGEQLVEIMKRNGMSTATVELLGDRDVLGPNITEGTMAWFNLWVSDPEGA